MTLEEELYSIEILSDLTQVGSTKLVGYLPLDTISKYAGVSGVSKIEQWAQNKGLQSKVFTTGSVASGALYVWEETGLTEFLKENAYEFFRAGVPIFSNEYIYHIQHYLVKSAEYPKAYELVGKTFNDERWR